MPSSLEILDTFRECLSEAEAAFGPRSPGWKYSIRLRPSGGPETVVTSKGMVTVWLTANLTRVGLLFEAGHEAVHCLNPGRDSTYLEEAVATAFSRSLVHNRFGQPRLASTKLTSEYSLALSMAASVDWDVVRLGKRLRYQVGTLRKTRPETVLGLYPRAPVLRRRTGLSS